MKRPFLGALLILSVLALLSPLAAQEFKRGDWMIGIGGGPESSKYSYAIRSYWPLSIYFAHQNFNSFAKSLRVEYAVRNDFSLALGYSEVRASKGVATVYGPPNDQGWYQVFSDNTSMTSSEIGLSGAYHLPFIRVRRLDPMLTAGIKVGRSGVILPTRVIDFPPEMVGPGDWINNIERPEYHVRHLSSWLALGCRYWLFQRLAVGGHCRLDYLLSSRITPDSSNWTSNLGMDKKTRTGIYFEIVVKL